MIQLFNVSKTYVDKTAFGEVKIHALTDINLYIRKGEFAFVVGASGAGKSTLTKLIIREELPTQGQIMTEGRSIIRMKQKEIPIYRRKIGFVFQSFRLMTSRTVYENVAFAAEAIEMPAAEVKKRVPAMLDMVGLLDKQKAFPHQLSGGEQQRVSIARAMVNTPMMIIADEPTGDLDPQMSFEIMNLFQAINSRGTTMLVVTHDKEMVDLFKKRVIRLDRGRIVRDEERGTYNGAS